MRRIYFLWLLLGCLPFGWLVAMANDQSPPEFELFLSRFPEGINAEWRNIDLQQQWIPTQEAQQYVWAPLKKRIQADSSFFAMEERLSVFSSFQGNPLPDDMLLNHTRILPIGHTRHGDYHIVLVHFDMLVHLAVYSGTGQLLDIVAVSGQAGNFSQLLDSRSEYNLEWHAGSFSRTGHRSVDTPIEGSAEYAYSRKPISDHFSITDAGRIRLDSTIAHSLHGSFINTATGEWICLANTHTGLTKVAYRDSETKPWVFPSIHSVDAASHTVAVRFANSPLVYKLVQSRDGHTLTRYANDGSQPQTFVSRAMRVGC